MNIQQRIASCSYEEVSKALARPKELNVKDYCGFAREFPSLLHTSGLIQAVSFAHAKGGHQAELLASIGKILSVCKFIPAGTNVLEVARNAKLENYLLLSRRCLQIAIWLKRYSEALGPDKDE